MINIQRHIIDSLGFDVQVALQEYSDALEAHKYTVDVPRPTAHYLVEEIYKDGGQFTVIEPEVEEPLPPPIEMFPMNERVNMERDRRVYNGFMFQGKLYQFDPSSKARVTGAATLAKFAIFGGAQPGNLRWMNPNVDFTWTAADNSSNPMDAQTCSAFGDAAAVHEQVHFLAGKALKAIDPIPADYTDDKYWPNVS